jgi:hypothetical protein
MPLSITHDTRSVDEEDRYSDVTADYNAAKGDDETVDHVCGTYTVSRSDEAYFIVS